MKLVAATNNDKKLIELRGILRQLGVQVLTLNELGVESDPEETGKTFLENALIKARAACEKTGLPAVADDSGLCVDALDGAPGIYSARFGAPEAKSSQDRNNLLLKKMEGIPVPARGAHFACAIVCVFPDGTQITAEGECSGRILTQREGDGGFGYDPLFYMPEHGMTMAQMPTALKNTVSHRALALRSFAAKLGPLIGQDGSCGA